MEGLALTFPPPPFYYKSFTEENVELVRGKSPEEQRLLEEPLAYLVPPVAPDAASYRGFGSIWNTKEVLLPLEDAGIERLYSDLGDDFNGLTGELQKLLRQALVEYVALLGTMSRNPEKFPAIVEKLRTILINMHHLLNLYRPHQTRESIIHLMQEQIAEIQKRTESTRESNQEIEAKLDQYARLLPQRNAFAPEQQQDLGEWKGLNLSIDPQPMDEEMAVE